MTNAVTDPTKTPLDNFREAMTERIAKDASTLMPDDVLKQLCEDAINGVLEEAMAAGDYNREEGWLRKAIKEECGAKVRATVDEILDNKEDMRIAVRQTVSEVLPTVIADAITGSLQYSVGNKIDTLISRNF